MKWFAIGLAAGVLLGAMGARLRTQSEASAFRSEPIVRLCPLLQHRTAEALRDWRAHTDDWEAGYRYATRRDRWEKVRRAVRLDLQDPANPPEPVSEEMAEVAQWLQLNASTQDQTRRAKLLGLELKAVPESIERQMKVE